MPTVTVYRHGATSGMGNPDATPPERTEVKGWSAHAIRRNLQFLYSVDETRLQGLQGSAVTLTVKDCPDTAKEWGTARDSFFKCLRREGVHLVHWVTEWQRRGVPHLHLAVYWPEGVRKPPGALLRHWLRITEVWGSRASGQHVTPIYDVLGWNQYVSKHAARGLRHYQRNPQNVPEGWRGGSSGRMWGKLGKWSIQERYQLDLEPYEFWRLRRLVRGWREADARKLLYAHKGVVGLPGFPDPRRIKAARGMLRCPHARLSAVRGVSEWIPEELMVRMTGWAQATKPPEAQ